MYYNFSNHFHVNIRTKDFFEVNKYYITLSSINLLIKEKQIEESLTLEAINKYKIDINKQNPYSI